MHENRPDPDPGLPPALEPGRCHGCCRWAPTRSVTYRQNIGLLVFRLRRGVQGPLCAPCRQHYFWTYTGVTVVLGWWGLISFFTTLFILPMNIANHLRGLRDDHRIPVADTAGRCHWCGCPALRRTGIAPALLVAVIFGGLLAFSGLRYLSDGWLASLTRLAVAAVPITSVVIVLLHPFASCPSCGNVQRAGDGPPSAS